MNIAANQNVDVNGTKDSMCNMIIACRRRAILQSRRALSISFGPWLADDNGLIPVF
jgi:hypothetical protein